MQRTADVSRNMFDESKRYVSRIVQQTNLARRPGVDADFNDYQVILHTNLKRFIKQVLGNGSPNNGFLIQESSSPTNNFLILGGDGTDENMGCLYVEGIRCALKSTTIEYCSDGEEPNDIHYKVTAIEALILTCSEANWVVNELANRKLVANASDGTEYTILSNTQTTITVSAGDMTTVAAIGDYFYVKPSTPDGSDRTDIVFLDVFSDEWDSDEDSGLIHSVEGANYVSMLAEKTRNVIVVREGSTTLPTSGYVDPDGNKHYYYKIATLARTNLNASISGTMMTDEREKIDRAFGIVPTLTVGGGYGSSGLSVDGDGNLEADGNCTFDGDLLVGGKLVINYDAVAVTETSDLYFLNSSLSNAPRMRFNGTLLGEGARLTWNRSLYISSPAGYNTWLLIGVSDPADECYFAMGHMATGLIAEHRIYDGTEPNEMIFQIYETSGSFTNDPKFTFKSTAGDVVLRSEGIIEQTGYYISLSRDAADLTTNAQLVFGNPDLTGVPTITWDGTLKKTRVNNTIRAEGNTTLSTNYAMLEAYPNNNYKAYLRLHGLTTDLAKGGTSYFDLNIGNDSGTVTLTDYPNVVRFLLKLETGSFGSHDNEFVFYTVNTAGTTLHDTLFSFYGNLSAHGASHALNSDYSGAAQGCYLYFAANDVSTNPSLGFVASTEFRFNFPLTLAYGFLDNQYVKLEPKIAANAAFVMTMEASGVSYGNCNWQFRSVGTSPYIAYLECDYRSGSWGIGRPILVIQNAAVGVAQANNCLLRVAGEIEQYGLNFYLNADGTYASESCTVYFSGAGGSPMLRWDHTDQMFKLNNPIQINNLVNIVPRAADPASPQNGDIWMLTTGELKCRSNGVTKTVTLT